MGSYIEAIIFSSAGTAPPVPDGFTIVPLTTGLSMLPITEDQVRRLDPSTVGDDRIPAGWMLKQPVAALARSISADRAVVYIHSETFGGPGTREAIAFRFGKLLYGPAGTSDIEHDLEPGYHLAWGHNNAVNSGLRAIGVNAAGEDDEYATIGLAKHRTTEDWLRDGTGHVRS
jgi:hypothetical protein